MAGVVVNIKVCSPLKLRSGLTGKCHAICHYSYNLPLWRIKTNSTAILQLENLGHFKLLKKLSDLIKIM
jgi:hypothetical protein